MPSVGMRRTTRVFGARVLRSGRRLWTGPGVGKYVKNNNGEEWFELLDNSRDGGGDAIKRKDRGQNGNGVVSEPDVTGMDVDEKVAESALEKVAQEAVVADNQVGRRWGIVYTRKRKKVGYSVVDFPAGGDKNRISDDKRYGKQFFRKKWRKTEMFKACDSSASLVAQEKSHVNAGRQSLMVVVDPSCSNLYLVTCFLSSVLRYMWKSRVGLHQLSAFIHSRPIVLVYSSCGIRFFQDSKVIIGRGTCMLWDANTFVPVFTMDYSSVPHCFMYLHSRRLLQFDHLICSLGRSTADLDEEDDRMEATCMFSELDQASETVDLVVSSTVVNSGKIEVSPTNDNTSNSVGRSTQLRSGRLAQNRRSSLRSKRGRRPSSLGTRKTSGALASSLLNFRHNVTQLSPLAPRRELRSSDHRNTATNIKPVKSALEGSKPEVDPTSCSANVLVMDSEKCSRLEGAIVSLEISAEKQWHLAIKRDGMDPYSLIAQKDMRPCSCNRFTHAIMWSIDNDWKLEFPDRQDWLIFKELYKKCSDNNAQDPAENFIPVPGVHEVSGYINSSSSVFVRPVSYISMKDDELSRALARRTANYDMDSEDEEWLCKFNSEFDAEDVVHNLLSAEDFEMVIDAFEKGFYCNPDDFSDEYTTPQISLCLERGVLEAVYRFWIKKKKQRRSVLVKIFQLYQRRRTQLIPSSVLRKKRSFKRQGSLIARGKQRPLLQAMVAEQDAREQQNALVKVEEAKAVANRSEGLAVLKRQIAQQLMETADLATYKATMALKIAELAQIAKTPDAVDPFFSVK